MGGLGLAWVAAGLMAAYTSGPGTQSSGGTWLKWLALPCLAGAVGLFLSWLRKAIRNPGTGPTPLAQKVVMGVALLALLAGGNAYQQFDGILEGVHIPGDGAYGVSFLTGRERIQTAVVTWDRFTTSETALEPTARAFAGEDAPMTLLAWGFATYVGLVLPAYAALVALLVLWILRGLENRRRQIEATAQEGRVDALKAIGSLALGLLAVAVFADALAGWLAPTLTRDAWATRSPGVVPHVSRVLGFLLSASFLARILSALAIVLYLAVAGLFLARHADATTEKWTGARGIFQSLLAVRVQILATIMLVLLLVQEQVPDAVRRWSDDPAPMAWGLAFTVLLALGLWHSGRWLLAYADPGRQTGSWRLTFAFAALGLVAVIVFSLPEGWGFHPVAVGALAILVVGHLLHAYWAREQPPPPMERPGWGRQILPPLLAAAALALVGLAVLRAGPGDLVYASLRGQPTGQAAFRTLIALLLLGAAGVAYTGLKAFAARHAPSSRVLSLVWVPIAAASATVVVWLVIAWVLSRSLVDVAPALGVVGVLTSFLVLATYGLSALVASANRIVRYAPPVLRELGFRRLPVLTLVVVWAVIAATVGGAGRMHDVVPRETGNDVRSGIDLSSAFSRWVRSNCLLSEGSSAAAPGQRTLPAVPLVLVASAGGGIRAAVWTAKVMQRAIGFEQPDPCTPDGPFPEGPLSTRGNWVFAMSGVSGGSLGLTEYAAQLPQGAPPEGGNRWIRDRLGGDFLSPPLAWMLFVETPWSLFRFSADSDRAVALEESWEQAWPDGEPGLRADVFRFQNHHPGIPWLVLNGTTVESGCRFNASALALSGRTHTAPPARCLVSEDLETSRGVLGATVDLAPFLCANQGISLAKLALLSARFPLVSPAGHLEQCALDTSTSGGNEIAQPALDTFVVDGGYLENSGASTALGLWSGLGPLVEAHNLDPRARACIVPFMIQIDNRYEDPLAAGTVPDPSQLTAPVSTFRATREGRTSEARQDAQLDFSRPVRSSGVGFRFTKPDIRGRTDISTRYAHFTTLSHPGPKAPLGWALSSASFDDLFDQVRQNGASQRQVDSWFDGLSCTVAR